MRSSSALVSEQAKVKEKAEAESSSLPLPLPFLLLFLYLFLNLYLPLHLPVYCTLSKLLRHDGAAAAFESAVVDTVRHDLTERFGHPCGMIGAGCRAFRQSSDVTPGRIEDAQGGVRRLGYGILDIRETRHRVGRNARNREFRVVQDDGLFTFVKPRPDQSPVLQLRLCRSPTRCVWPRRRFRSSRWPSVIGEGLVAACTVGVGPGTAAERPA